MRIPDFATVTIFLKSHHHFLVVLEHACFMMVEASTKLNMVLFSNSVE